MKILSAIFDRILDAFASIAGFFLIALMLIEVFEVITRRFFRSPSIWTVETCEYLLFFITFLGAAWLLKKKGHISVNLLMERLKPRNRTYLDLFSSFMGIVISLIIFGYGVKTTWECYVTGIKIVKTLSLPKWYFLSFIPLGYLLILFEFIRQLLGHFRSLGLHKKGA